MGFVNNENGFARAYFQKNVSNYPITLSNFLQLRSLSVEGNTAQGCGDKTINLFDYKNCAKLNGYIAKPALNWKTGAIVGSSLSHTFYMECKPNTTYTLKRKRIEHYDGAPLSIYRLGYSSNVPIITNDSVVTDFIGESSSNELVLSITTDNNAKYICFCISYWDKITDKQDFFMLVEGSYTDETMPTYEPYGCKIPLIIQGNMFNNIETPKGFNQAVRQSSNTGVDVIAKANTGRAFVWYSIKVKPGKYSFSVKPGASGYVDIYESDGVDWWNSKVTLSANIKTFSTFSVTRPYIYVALFGKIGTSVVTNFDEIMLVAGEYTSDTMPPYGSYNAPQTFPIYLDAPLHGNGAISDTVELNMENRVAIITRRFSLDDTGEIIEIVAPITTDISDKIDWNSIPRLWRGTVIITADTTVSPSSIGATYKSTKI